MHWGSISQTAYLLTNRRRYFGVQQNLRGWVMPTQQEEATPHAAAADLHSAREQYTDNSPKPDQFTMQQVLRKAQHAALQVQHVAAALMYAHPPQKGRAAGNKCAGCCQKHLHNIAGTMEVTAVHPCLHLMCLHSTAHAATASPDIDTSTMPAAPLQQTTVSTRGR